MSTSGEGDGTTRRNFMKALGAGAAAGVAGCSQVTGNGDE
ncbi:MAG: twin-arginine translocation signal domain-containing protein, partial [Candidatus Nanohalobium sp.]